LTFIGNAPFSDAPGIAMYNKGAGAGASVSLDFYNTPYNGGIPQAKVKALDDGAYSDHLTFWTKVPGASGNPVTEKMRITSAGNVGIGTTTPTATLHVNGTGLFNGGVTFGSPVTFASGQTFPGTGTVTAVNHGTYLTGGGTSGSVTLDVDTSKVPTLGAANNTFTGGISAGSYSMSGIGVSGSGSSLGVSGSSGSGCGVYGQSSSGDGVEGYSPGGFGVAGYSGSSIGVYGDSSFSAGVGGSFNSGSATGRALTAAVNNTTVMNVDANGVHAGAGMTGTPLAYGFFNSVGVLQVGSSNISCTFAGLEYIISITGQAYVVSQFVTNVTAAGGFAVPSLSTASNNLVITFFNATGLPIPAPNGFSVTVYKP
jgi:hypothetical protein